MLIVLHLSARAEAASDVRSAGGATTWRTSVDSPEETEDVSSFIFAGSEMHRSPSSGLAQGAVSDASATAAAMPSARPTEVAPQLLEEEERVLEAWEATFAAGVFESKKAVEAEDCDVGSWVRDSENSGAAVPTRMLNAEAQLQVAESAPADRWKEKTAERALRIYYHAKWLAEHNYERAAEHRYREAARLARRCRRSVLASHSLARLGYFLVHWRREGEAAEVLQESMKLNTKSNPLAPYLHGVLERKVANDDVERLRTAEDAILNSAEQPSEELEVERNRLIGEIGYWREAEESTRQCLASSDTAYVLICLCGHAAAFFRQVVFR